MSAVTVLKPSRTGALLHSQTTNRTSCSLGQPARARISASTPGGVMGRVAIREDCSSLQPASVFTHVSRLLEKTACPAPDDSLLTHTVASDPVTRTAVTSECD